MICKYAIGVPSWSLIKLPNHGNGWAFPSCLCLGGHWSVTSAKLSDSIITNTVFSIFSKGICHVSGTVLGLEDTNVSETCSLPSKGSQEQRDKWWSIWRYICSKPTKRVPVFIRLLLNFSNYSKMEGKPEKHIYKVVIIYRSFIFHTLKVCHGFWLSHSMFSRGVVIFANMLVFYLQAKLLVQESLTFQAVHSSF